MVRRVAISPSGRQPSWIAPASVWQEKIARRGEDGPPLIFASDTRVALGVFDGLGGSGAHEVETPSGEVFTSARFAADLAFRVTRDVFCDFGFQEHDPNGRTKGIIGAARHASPRQFSTEILRSSLRERLSSEFEAAARSFGLGSQLRGSISKRLPTTICLLILEPVDARADQIVATSIWAGDSRAYAWLPARGLVQLTRDHCRRPVDALQAIREDAPMSNFVSPDLPFWLEMNASLLDVPCLAFCSTDGGFNFFPSPMEFEAAIVDSLDAGEGCDARIRAIERRIAEVTKDDVAMVFSGAGWEADKAVEMAVAKARSRLSALLTPLETQKAKLAAAALSGADINLEEQTAALDQLRKEIWSTYRISYEALPPEAAPDEPRSFR